MNLSVLALAPLVLLATPALRAQDLLHYKFDDVCNDRAINYAAGSPAPSEGTIVSTLPGAPASSWKAGVFGGALAGGVLSPTPAVGNYVDTGWNPGTITGSMTWATWLKMDPAAPTPTLTYIFGNGSTFRVFTGGGGFFLTSSWGGGNVNTVANIQTLARQGWVHLALVLDGSAMTGTYYINGVPEAPIVLTSQVNWTGTSFFVGKHSSTIYWNIFDLDEFVLVNRAMTAAEIGALASSARAGDARYGSGGCGPMRLRSTGGVPNVGNVGYALVVDSPGAGAWSLNIGLSRCTFGGVGLPFDLGAIAPQFAGCVVEAGQELGSIGGAKPAGPLTIPLVIPPIPSLAGLTLFLQAPGIDGASGRFVLSNAFSIGIGL